jgi:GNAT superfamily N-acetyltransferase
VQSHPPNELSFRRATANDTVRLQTIRKAAFAPVFASFRTILGDEIYDIAQRREDEGQEAHLLSLIAGDGGWTLYVGQQGHEIVAFVSFLLNPQTRVGEIGLNAVDPAFAGAGVGAAMYAFALAQMRAAEMLVATVATGGDPSHAPARRALQKAGFNTSIPSVWMCHKLSP